MQLADFASSCARRGGQVIARRIPSHAMQHYVGPMIRHVAHGIAAHGPRVANLACHWLPMAAAVGIGLGAPVNLVELPARSALPSQAAVGVDAAPSAGGLDEFPGPGYGFGGAAQAGTQTFAAMTPEAGLAGFLLPLYGTPIELTPARLPAAIFRAGGVPPAGPALDAPLPAALPVTLPDLGSAPPTGKAAPSLAVAEVSEPSTALLLSGGALALLLLRRRKGRIWRR